jgi:hypothetical protein
MPLFDSPLLLALVISVVGSTLLVWHRHGGARWMFAVGGFFFVLGRVMIAAICLFLLTVTIDMMRYRGSDALLMGSAFCIAILAFAGWSIFAVIRVVGRDAFGSAQEQAARTRYTDGHP